MLSISAAAMTWAASAVADSPNLKGDYGATGSASCIVSSAGFSPSNGGYVALGTGPGQWLAVQGVRTFNGDGTGSATYYLMGVERPFNPSGPGFGDAFSVKLTWSFTYTVNGDTWTTDVAKGTLISGVLTAGPSAGVTFTIAGFPTFTGQVSTNGSTLTAATLTPSEEILNFAFTPPVTTYRVCERSEVLINMK
jgi:hypothetical protein